MTQPGLRRPVGARRLRSVTAIAHWLARAGVRPNTVSIASVVVSCLAGAALVAGAHAPPGVRAATLLFTGVCILVRLLCNVLDGLTAVEGGLATKSGVIFNELPDRLSDAVLLVGTGYAASDIALAPALGWAAALGAVFTAYVRALGGASGAPQDFAGPMAKQQRMATLIAACLLAAPLAATPWCSRLFVVALALILAGSALTAARRAVRTIRWLEAS